MSLARETYRGNHTNRLYEKDHGYSIYGIFKIDMLGNISDGGHGFTGCFPDCRKNSSPAIFVHFQHTC
jgi:hypothetical protein